jgi:hypothetical protein
VVDLCITQVSRDRTSALYIISDIHVPYTEVPIHVPKTALLRCRLMAIMAMRMSLLSDAFPVIWLTEDK